MLRPYSDCGKTDGVGASSIAVEGMSYENAQGDGHGCGELRLPFITAAFDTSSCSVEPGGSGHAGSSCDSWFAIDASFAGYAGVTGCSCDSGGTGRSRLEKQTRLGLDALGRWAGSGLLGLAHSAER
jgi:hypothetical protein